MDGGVGVHNLYVTADPQEEPVESVISKKYRRKLAGKITAIKDTNLKLTDFSDKDEVNAEHAYLEPSTPISNIVSHRWPPENTTTFNKGLLNRSSKSEEPRTSMTGSINSKIGSHNSHPSPAQQTFPLT
jgi:hypothetical protein